MDKAAAPTATGAATTASDIDTVSAKVEAMDIEEKKEEAEASTEGTAAAAPAAGPSDVSMSEGHKAPDAVPAATGDATGDMQLPGDTRDAAMEDAELPGDTQDAAMEDAELPDDMPELEEGVGVDDIEEGFTDDDHDDKDTPPADPTVAIVEAMTQKEEGNAAFKDGDYTAAVRSYRKGTTLLKPFNKNNTGDEQVKSLLLTLQTNLSMVCYKQDKHKMSRDVATKALEIDPINVKALYRRAVAYRKLGDAESARSDLREALKHEPNNKAVRKELVSIKKDVEASRSKEKERLQKAFGAKKGGSSFLYNDKEEEERRKAEEKKRQEEAAAEALKKRKIEWEDECVRRMSHNEEAISFEDWEKERKKEEEEEDQARKKAKKEEEERRKAEQRAAKAVAKKNDVVVDESDDELTESELAMMRGYKKTKDGRTTSYFTREVSEEEKALLQQAAGPKLIGSATSSAATTPTALSPIPASNSQESTTATGTGTAAASAWNQAGTWEEKDTSAWCSACLKKHLTSASAVSGTYSGVVKEVKDCSGDASVVLTRGKKRYVFDYHLTVKFDIIHIGEVAGVINADEIDEDEADETTTSSRSAPAETVVAAGTLKLPDISSTVTIEELEIEPSSGWKKKPSDAHTAGVMECRDQLVEEVRQSVSSFVSEFNEQY